VSIGTGSQTITNTALSVDGNIYLNNANGYDNKIYSLTNNGGNSYPHDLIGTYGGWNPNFVYIAGYNQTNTTSTSPTGLVNTTEVMIGGAGSSLPLEVTGTLMVDGSGTTCCGGNAPPAGVAMQVNGNVLLSTPAGQGQSSFIQFPDGSVQTTAFTGLSCTTGADYAEAVDVTGDRSTYAPGDLLLVDPATPGKFLKSNLAYSTLVAGIYSTKPGFVGRKQAATPESRTTEVPMAMVGRVPTKVSAENGPIKVGDLLVTSSTPGYAMKGTDPSRMLGAVVGKALGALDSGTGVIEVLVTLQ
jgi:hypothetical protein